MNQEATPPITIRFVNVKKHFKEVVLFKGFRNYLNNKEAQESKRKRSALDTEQGTKLRTRRTFS